MEAATLHIIDTATGEVKEIHRDHCPNCEQYRAETEELTKKFKGALLEIRRLKADKEAELMGAPERPQVELLHALWKVACNRRRDLHVADWERMTRMVRKHGLRLCLAGIAGAAYDPNLSRPRKNGKRERFDDLELIFRETSKLLNFADRVPSGWEPNVAKIAAIGGVSEQWVSDILEGRWKA